MLQLCTLLSCAATPDPAPMSTAAEMHATDSAASTGVTPDQEHGGGVTGGVSNSWVRHARGNTGLPISCLQDVVRLCEALLRDAAAVRETVAQACDAESFQWLATAGGAAPAQQFIEVYKAAVTDDMFALAQIVASLVAAADSNGCSSPYHPSQLALAALSAGSGSDLLQQLFSLLCSMAKLSDALGVGNEPRRTQSQAEITARTRGCLMSAAAKAAALIVGADAAGQQQPHPHDVTSHAAAATVSKLPGLFVLGRCCMAWGQDLQGFASKASQPGIWGNDQFDAECALSPVQQWLENNTTQEQLTAFGYAPQASLQQLQQVMTALQAIRESAASGQCELSHFMEAAQQLQSAGSVLSLFAVPCLCNSPSCANLSGWSELGLVSGRSCVCGGCRVARYCGRACQRLAWKQHKPVCAALSAAAPHAAPAPAAAMSSSLSSP
jgi:hypothetical protein